MSTRWSLWGGSQPAHAPTTIAHADPAAPRRARAKRPPSARRRVTVSPGPWCRGAPFDLDITADELLRDLDPGAWRDRRPPGGGA